MNNTQFLLRMNMESFNKHTHINERKAVTELFYFFLSPTLVVSYYFFETQCSLICFLIKFWVFYGFLIPFKLKKFNTRSNLLLILKLMNISERTIIQIIDYAIA